MFLIGRLQNSSVKVDKKYKIHRFKLIFKNGFLFYAEYNFRLFIRLLFEKTDVYHANDLDTLLPMWVISKFKKKPIVYDSHEYFTGVGEIQNRPLVKYIWKTIERNIFPKLKHVITVNQSIADLYFKDYNTLPKVIRNLPVKSKVEKIKSKSDLGLPLNKPIVILQGAGINIDRGSEELLEAIAMQDYFFLCIVGKGDVIEKLKNRSRKSDLLKKVIFINTLPYNEMMQYTLNADIGVSLDKDNNINHKFSLPNKIFDYIKAEIPILASDLIEISNVISKYKVGCTISEISPDSILIGLNSVLKIKEEPSFKNRFERAINDLNWDNESQILNEMYKKF